MTYADFSIYARKLIFLFLIILTHSCREEEILFETLDSSKTNIHFNNRIVQSDSINQLDIENVYNGGGVGTGDFNNDGLPDIFFSGNAVPNKLYLNEGKLKFRDITSEAGIIDDGKWYRGVAIIDINNDGWQDLYICATLRKKPEERLNRLYINRGLNEDKIPFFTEEAASYGLDINFHSTQAVFFDYDNDDDLDVYIVANEISKRYSPYMFRPVLKNGSNPSTGKLLRNDWSDSLKHPVYTDVSAVAGILTEGYGHSATIVDMNNDGWKDIFVGNDFLTNDLLWINNQDGTFTDRIKEYFKHTSANSMGNDVADINNDGLQDVFTLDMNPEDNYRKKMMLNPNSYQLYQNTERYNYSYQYVRNTLQLNQGPRVGENDSIGIPAFSEIGYLAGITATDWSWTPMITDFDNDGLRDIIISNGFPRDITDHDFVMFRSNAYKVSSKEQILNQVPEVKLRNYAFRNNGNLTFSDVSQKWGFTVPTFSNGSAYADLDNDGDLDLAISNINDEASILKNTSRDKNPEKTNYLRIRLNGSKNNSRGYGSWIEVYYNGKKQVLEFSPYRGYLSTVEDVAHFGLGGSTSVDSVIVKWPLGRQQVLRQVTVNQLLNIDIKDAKPVQDKLPDAVAENTLFTEITSSVGIKYEHRETDFVDFNIQKLLPHKFSEYGPSLAAGDIDLNGFDDLICGGSANNSAMIFFQQKNGSFISRPLLSQSETMSKSWDDAGILLFDADRDTDLDLFITSGGFEQGANDPAYSDNFYINDGKGNFRESVNAIPANTTSKFCVRAADYDKDGDNDLFIAGRVEPWKYPNPVSSFIYRNDSEKGKPKFTDATKEVAKELVNIGLVCDAVFSDFDNDGWTDLILAGEWMPLTMLKNENGIFRNITTETGIAGQAGWWNSISPGDFDNDGDIDYITGNLGLNSFYKADENTPAAIYAGDFDNNGSYDAFPSLYLSASHTDTTKKEFPAHTRDDAVKQMISMRSRFQNYRSYAVATIDQLFQKEQFENSLTLKASNFASSYCRNDGNNKFTIIPLPVEAQFSVLNGMISDDFNGDDNLDVVISGNDYGTDVSVGRYDALNGLVLKGDGKGNFEAMTILESGIYIPGNGKALAAFRGSDGSYLMAAAQNRGKLKIFRLNSADEIIEILPDDISAEIITSKGSNRKVEFYNGSSFLSQSGRFIKTSKNVTSLSILNNNGQKRELKTKENTSTGNE